MTVHIHPSILAADFARLGEEVAVVADADWLHVDVADNHFVPNLTLGLPVVEALARVSELPLDLHLMIENPDRWAARYVEAGADSVTFHAEAVADPVRLAREIRAMGARAGMAVNPGTSVDEFEDVLTELDLLLVMTIEPGFGGQAFREDVVPKIQRARELIVKHDVDVRLQVDGGISPATIDQAATAGADTFVAGTAVYATADPAAAVHALRTQAEQATSHAWWKLGS